MQTISSFYLILLGSVILFAILPAVGLDASYRHFLILAFIYAIVASNWDLTLGYGGILNFAHPAFFAIGVYIYSILARVVGVEPFLAIAAAGLASVAAACIIALPVLRLRGIYVILVTFAFGQICLQIVLSQSNVTGGSLGMVLVPSIEIGDWNFARDGRMGFYYLTLLALVLSTIYLRVITQSPFGRSIQALRDNEPYAVSRGVSVARARILTMAGSAIFTGFAGALYASYLRAASPEVFGFDLLIIFLSALLLGGTSTIVGPIMAAVVLTLLSEWMMELGAWRFLVLAAVIVAVLRFYPGGLYALVTRAGGALTARRRLGGRPRTAA